MDHVRARIAVCACSAFLIALLASRADAAEAEPGPRVDDAPEEFTETESGLKYRILRKGDGAGPTGKSSVTVHYKGWLDDETVFDSSYERGKRVTFPLAAVIRGWTEGLQLVQQGGMIELEIPSELGYGARGAGKIPPDATLHFVVELFEFETPLEPGPSDPDAPKEFATAESGVKYRILRKGDGRKPLAEDTVKVHYKGWLDNGKVFESSYNSGKPVSFPWSRIVETWTDVMQLVEAGGMIELEIPSKLGYGARGAGNVIPPNATLHFIVELIEIQ